MKDKLKNKGFTLVELTVVIAILGIVSSIILFNYNNFNAGVSLENLSQEIALTIRKAQVSTIGISGVNVPDGFGGEVRQFPSYGVHLYLPANSSSLTEGNKKSFIYFADLGTPSDKIYNQTDPTNCGESYLSTSATSPNECLDIMNIVSTDEISGFCLTDSTNSQNCYLNSSNSPAIDIAFIRPNPEAYFNCTINGAPCVNSGISSVSIMLKSAMSTKTKTVTVWNTGQISVD